MFFNKKHTTGVASSMVKLAMILPFFFLSHLFAAGGPPDREEGSKLCEADARSHCKSDYLLGGRKGVQACLERKVDELSPPCRNFIKKVKAFKEKMNHNCGNDIKSHCSSFAGNPEQMRSCLRKNRNKFSPACQDFLHKNRRKPG